MKDLQKEKKTKKFFRLFILEGIMVFFGIFLGYYKALDLRDYVEKKFFASNFKNQGA